MQICPFCKKGIEKGQMMAVLSFPVECVNEKSEYALVGGTFFENERVIHADCFGQHVPQLDKILSGKPVLTPIISQKPKEPVSSFGELAENLRLALLEIGESKEELTNGKIYTFIAQNRGVQDVSELLEVWFRNRNKFE